MACKPGTIKPHAKFEGEIYALTKEEGGRHTPFFTNYKPQFFLRTADITGLVPRLPVCMWKDRHPSRFLQPPEAEQL